MAKYHFQAASVRAAFEGQGEAESRPVDIVVLSVGVKKWKAEDLNRPDLAAAVGAALPHCTDVKSQQRLLAMRLAASGQFTAAEVAEREVNWCP